MNGSRTLGALAILAAILGAWLFAISGSAHATVATLPAPPAGSDDQITLIESDENGIMVAVQVDSLTLEHQTASDTVYEVITIPGFGSNSAPGSPQVPTRELLLGIPLDADFQLRVSVQESEAIPGPHRLLPAPTPLLQQDADSPLGIGAPGAAAAGWEYVEDKAAYAQDALYPDAIARIASTGFMRDQRFIAIEVNPVQYSPVSGNLIWYKKFTVEIDFTHRPGAELKAASQPDPSFETALSSSLLNYTSAAAWRGRLTSATLATSLDIAALDVESPMYKIMVNEDGIYQVTAADLVAAGILVDTIPTTTYKLSYRGREVPIRVIETDGQLASFWFYGEQSQTKYTDTNVYWLTYDTSPPPGAEPGLRMPTRSVPPAAEIPVSAYYLDTIRFEEDHVYRSNMPWAEDFDPDPWDHWFWNNTNFYWPEPDNPSYKKVQTFPGQLSNLSPSQYTTALTVFMSGYSGSWKTYPDHCTEFRVNGALIGQYSWDGQYTDELVSFAINSNILEEGPNTVEAVVCPSGAQWDNTYYDWFAVDVRRIYQAENDSLTFDVAEAGWQYRLDGFSADTVELFDISDTYAVSHLINVEVTYQDTQYTAAFYDAESGPGTRYLALTHDRLKSPLAIEAYSPANLADPANQADYIVIAPPEFVPDVQPLATHREGQGLTVQVVELGTIFDEFNYGIYSPEAIRDFLSYAFHNWAPDAPAYVLLVGDGTYDYKGNIPQGNPNLLPPYLAWVDPWIGETAADNRYVTVAGDDPFPDMHIGRLPAENITQLQTMVAKTISYEIDPAPQDWVERVLFVTDDYPDSSGNFYDFSDDLVNNYLPDPYVPVKAYYLNTCLTGAACTQAILDTLNTTGALFVNYIGHGGVQVWAGYPATIWRIDDLAGLVPTSRLPVMLPMTCSEGSFHQAEKDALAEATVRLDGRGAVASWSATGLGVADGHDYLNKGFLHAALYEGVRELGAAADAGKARLFAANFSLDLLDTYHVLGDPALRLHSLPVVDVAVGQAVSGPEPPTPGDLLALTLTFTNTGPDVAAGVVLTDLLPSVLVTPVVVFSSPEVIGPVEGITLAWTINDLAPGASGTIVVETTVDPDWPEPEVSFFNKAQIAVQTHDLVPQNNVSWLGVNTKSVYLPLILKAH